MIRTVVAAAGVTAIVVGAIVPMVASMILDSVVPRVVAHLMLALLMVGRIIAAAARPGDGRHGECTGERECGHGFREAGVHV
ncbi:MAG: hypothetical protein ACJ76X_03450 [Solirubrobacteraceae bacterium]